MYKKKIGLTVIRKKKGKPPVIIYVDDLDGGP